VTCRSVSRAVERSIRSTLDGPAMTTSAASGSVVKPRPLPAATGRHVRFFSPSTRSRVDAAHRRLQFRNRLLMIAKNDPLGALLRELPRLAAYEVLALGYATIVERELLGRTGLEAAIIRLPKVYGPERNADFATVHAYADQPHWRWTHGYVENVASALALVALHPALPRRIYNVGEEATPSVAERLRRLPPSAIPPSADPAFDFRQDMVMDSSAIRTELGYREEVDYREGLRRTLAGHLPMTA